jgi:hypothetical protein
LTEGITDGVLAVEMKDVNREPDTIKIIIAYMTKMLEKLTVIVIEDVGR